MIKPPYTKKDLDDVAIEMRQLALRISRNEMQPCQKRIAAAILASEVLGLADRIADPENADWMK